VNDQISVTGPDMPLLPPVDFHHCGVEYHVFLDVTPKLYPHGVMLDAFLAGTLESVVREPAGRGDVLAYVRGPAARFIREGVAASREAWDREQKAKGVVGEARARSGYVSPQGIRFEVLLDVDEDKFPNGLQVSVQPIGAPQALPAVVIPGGDLIVRLGGEDGDKLRPALKATYAAALAHARAAREAQNGDRAVHG
jgi:hypothetical protein